MYEYMVSEVVKIVDGDTIDVKVDLGFHVNLEMRLRLYGIDTWEVRGVEREMGLAAKAALESLVLNGKTVWIKTIKDRQGKYGRYLAVLFIDDVNVNEWLVENGHGEVASY
jgi:micrococcal nuclease